MSSCSRATSPHTLDRDDDALLAPLAQATEGMAVYGHRDERGLADATKLVRPIALEKLTVDAPGWELQQSSPTEDACNVDGDLDEGTACSWWGLGTGVSGPVRVDGLLWGHHVVRVVRPDPSQGRSLARVLSAIGSATGFDDIAHASDRSRRIRGQRCMVAVRDVGWTRRVRRSRGRPRVVLDRDR